MSDNERVTSTAQSSRDAERVKLLNPLPSKPKPQQVENTSPASIKILLTAAQKRDRTLAAELDDWSTPLTSAERNARRAVRAASCPCAAPPCLLFFARARAMSFRGHLKRRCPLPAHIALRLVTGLQRALLHRVSSASALRRADVYTSTHISCSPRSFVGPLSASRVRAGRRLISGVPRRRSSASRCSRIYQFGRVLRVEGEEELLQQRAFALDSCSRSSK